MCGRFTLTLADAGFVALGLGIAPDALFEDRYVPRWNIAPMQEHWVVRAEREERRVTPAVWGLASTSGRASAPRPINVRSEGVVQGAFRTAFAERRCIVPVDGFFEWTGEGRTKRPFWFHRVDGAPFAFAGLCAEMSGPEGSTQTFTILTTTPNARVAPIHDRMPVILEDDEAIEEWLYARQRPERLHGLLRPASDTLLDVRAVSTRVNSVRHDDPACLVEAEAEMQGPLF